MVTDPTEELAAWLSINAEVPDDDFARQANDIAEHMRSRGWRFVRTECLDYLILSVVDVEGEEE